LQYNTGDTGNFFGMSFGPGNPLEFSYKIGGTPDLIIPKEYQPLFVD
jgi:hypothetical protein